MWLLTGIIGLKAALKYGDSGLNDHRSLTASELLKGLFGQL